MSDKKQSTETKSTKSDSSSTSDTTSTNTTKTDSGKTASETDNSSSTSTTSTTNTSSGRSAKESVGGSSAVHYGYFSNVKSEEYRSGWDTIWRDGKPGTKKTKRTKQHTRERLNIAFSMDSLPEHVKEALIDAARAQLKKSRVNYDNRAKSGTVKWRIECEVK